MSVMDDLKFVCADCIDDDGIRDFISSTAEDDTCSFCKATASEPVAAPLDEVIRHMRTCIERHYGDPANWLPYESAEGGYQGETFEIDELITDQLGITFPNDSDGHLFEAICDGMDNQLWCEKDPFGLNPEERLLFSWERFCEAIKHERRYFFLEEKRDDSEIYNPAQVLNMIFSYAQDAGLFVQLPRGAELFRARRQSSGHNYQTALELGLPPVEKAIQTNRMSPPGIVMMYASEDADTALAEFAIDAGEYAVGKFRTEREAMILDLTLRVPIPTIFHEIPDSLEWDPRPRLIFLREISRDISRPIDRDDRIHIEYVPTQVVTEYLRTVTTVDGRRVDGIRYNSSRPNAQKSLVLFATQDNLILPESERPRIYLSDDR